MNSPNVDWIIDWIHRMAQKYGGTVYVKDGYAVSDKGWYDWGQALCRERYGADFSAWPDEPPDEDVARAKAWEEGDWPEWAVKPEEAAPEAPK